MNILEVLTLCIKCQTRKLILFLYISHKICKRMRIGYYPIALRVYSSFEAGYIIYNEYNVIVNSLLYTIYLDLSLILYVERIFFPINC